ncbi:hypothetical protein HYC85_020514 [Camellia sinensis]|uniref:Uncharacterized protein n=1 Tax=Camellia sinensis TaxID=4442 RepID=A0A7J7GQ00_CAMSI|nr:hypothetical protein HYC85_020514 [Camellia sinensis]
MFRPPKGKDQYTGSVNKLFHHFYNIKDPFGVVGSPGKGVRAGSTVRILNLVPLLQYET